MHALCILPGRHTGNRTRQKTSEAPDCQTAAAGDSGSNSNRGSSPDLASSHPLHLVLEVVGARRPKLVRGPATSAPPMPLHVRAAGIVCGMLLPPAAEPIQDKRRRAD